MAPLLFVVSTLLIFNQIFPIGQCKLYGKWPVNGGNVENQKSVKSKIKIKNIDKLETKCIYTSSGGTSRVGYIAVDFEDNGYLSDRSGFLTKVNIDTCQEIWRINIAEVLGFDPESNWFPNRNSVVLFANSNGDKGVLFGTPNLNFGTNCYVMAVSQDDGGLLWRSLIGTPDDLQTIGCNVHGFTVDGDYAFGGISSFIGTIGNEWAFRGKMMKININNGDIVDEWYPLPFNDNKITDRYSGAGIWNVPSIIDDYLIFGTGNLYSYPDKIGECLLNPFDDHHDIDSFPINPCGEDKSDVKSWRCFEKNIYSNSFIVLDKNTFEEVLTIPLFGVDAYANGCPEFTDDDDISNGCPVVAGPDIDVTSIVPYKQGNKIFAAVHQKSGQFFVFEIPSGRLVLSQKLGPWSRDGGGPQWGFAVSTSKRIGVTINTGGRPYDQNRQSDYSSKAYKHVISDGKTTICDTGLVYGIDLHRGNILYNIINPYGNIGEDQCNDPIYDEYVDISAEGTCEAKRNPLDKRSANKKKYSEDDVNVVVPPKDSFVPPNANNVALFRGPATITGDLVFIPSGTGDIFVHNLKTGEYIRSIVCPSFEDENGVLRRGGIQGGITIIEDRIIFYCGLVWYQSIFDLTGDMMISMQLTKKSKSKKSK